MMIADNIKRLRENAGLSQAALARKLGVTRASVNAWEMELSAPTAQLSYCTGAIISHYDR